MSFSPLGVTNAVALIGKLYSYLYFIPLILFVENLELFSMFLLAVAIVEVLIVILFNKFCLVLQ